MPIGPKPIRLGLAKGRFHLPDDWDDDDEHIASLFNDGQIFPDVEGL